MWVTLQPFLRLDFRSYVYKTGRWGEFGGELYVWELMLMIDEE